jgi:hypothetical protein
MVQAQKIDIITKVELIFPLIFHEIASDKEILSCGKDR